MSFSNFFLGSKPKTQQLPTMNSQQMGILQQLLGQINPQQFNLGQNPLYQQGSNYLQNLLSGSPESTAAFEAPHLAEFNQRIIPQLAERFGGMGAQSSSAFRNALGEAGSNLQMQLAALRSGLQGYAAQQALGYAQAPGEMGLQQANLGLGTSPFAYQEQAGSQGFLPLLLAGLGGGLAGGAGAALGQAGGNAFASWLQNRKSQQTPQSSSPGSTGFFQNAFSNIGKGFRGSGF